MPIFIDFFLSDCFSLSAAIIIKITLSIPRIISKKVSVKKLIIIPVSIL